MNKKIDKRIKYRIVLDCETCPCDKDFDGVWAGLSLIKEGMYIKRKVL